MLRAICWLDRWLCSQFHALLKGRKTMDDLKKNRKVLLITGKTGTGKSRLVKKLRATYDRSIVLDPHEEYDGTIFFDFISFNSYISEHRDDRQFSIVCRFADETDIDYLFRSIWWVGDVTFIVEESNLFLDPRSKNDGFLKLTSQGRHVRVSLLCVSQRVPELPISFRAQKHTIVTFRQEEPYDLDMLELYGFDSEKVANLESSQGSSELIYGRHYLTVGEPLEEAQSVQLSGNEKSEDVS